MIRRIIVTALVLGGLSGAVMASAGLLATPAAACDANHTS